MKIAILGSGNIGTDLLQKVIRSKVLTCTLFVGRNLSSPGMQRATSLGVAVSDRGIEAIANDPSVCDVVFDCTSAQAHIEHWPILRALGKSVIDMTPAKLGRACIPALGAGVFGSGEPVNINMITCGGQASIPIARAIASATEQIDYIEVASSIASRSAGPATRMNLDEYIETTQEALMHFTGARRAKAILILNPAVPPIDMQTTIYANIRQPDLAEIGVRVQRMVDDLRTYVPGYELTVPPTLQDGRLVTTVKVIGAGDYLPKYAGNLDIINCAAIAVAERMATALEGQ